MLISLIIFSKGASLRLGLLEMSSAAIHDICGALLLSAVAMIVQMWLIHLLLDAGKG